MNHSFRRFKMAILVLFLTAWVIPSIKAEPQSSGNLGEICRAAVAAIMGHKMEIVKVDKIEGDIAYVFYARPSDQ